MRTKRTSYAPWRVVLIVEDDTDGRAVKRLVAAAGFNVQVDWLPANGIGNIRRKADGLIGLARDRIGSSGGCVAILVDRDGKDSTREEPHRSISSMCAKSGVPYVEAVEAMESWFLADDGIIAWLGLKPKARTDRVSDPKGEIAVAFLKRTKRTYRTRRARLQLADKATGPRTDRSESWAQAVGHLRDCRLGRRSGGRAAAAAALELET